MKGILKLTLGAIFIIALSGVAFSLYSNFLVDYSLRNLENAISLSVDTDPEERELLPIAQRIYRQFLRDMALEEVASGEAPAERLALLDMAAHSIGEAEIRGGTQRAGVYLSQLSGEEKSKRSPVLKVLDPIYEKIERGVQSFLSFWRYFYEKWIVKAPPELVENEYAAVHLLAQAERREAEKKWDEALAYYRKYLDRYASRSESGFVMTAMAQILIEQGNFDEAQKLLERARAKFFGTESAELAAAMLNRVHSLRERAELIRQLKKWVAEEQDPEKKSVFQLKLGLAYLSTYDFTRAEKILQELASNPDVSARTKAKFYLGWLYKRQEKLEASDRVFSELLQDPSLESEFSLGLRAQLADLYYQKKDVQKALALYEELSQQAVQSGGQVSQRAWQSLAALERAKIYFFDLQDSTLGKESLDQLAAILGDLEVEDLQASFGEFSRESLRRLAFEALMAGHVHHAYDLLMKNLGLYPGDGWTLSGLATIHLLFGEPDKALELAARGYQSRTDEYTLSVYGYVLTQFGRFQEALSYYQESLSMNPAYIPAKFNLAYTYLEVGLPEKGLEILSQMKENIKVGEGYLQSMILNNMGYAHWRMGDIEKAKVHFKQALDVTSDFAMADRNLKQIAAGRIPQAAQLRE